MFTGQSLKLIRLDDDIVELSFDRAGETINKFDVRTIDELKAVTALLRDAADVRGVLVTSAKDTFIVGADIFEFVPLFRRSAEELEAYIADQASAFTGFSDLPFPTVAAINGLALGGGFEMALASDYRVMSSAAQVGLPEVGLGIFPAYGGTVRLPRLIGLAATIDWISSGKPQAASTALAADAVDRIADPAQLRGAALDVSR